MVYFMDTYLQSTTGTVMDYDIDSATYKWQIYDGEECTMGYKTEV